MPSAAARAKRAGSDGVGQLVDGRYRVEKNLGRGGMGVVYQVVDESIQRTMALKQLLQHVVAEKPAAVALFQREYHTLAQLAHPLIIEVYDYGVDENGPYYTMEELCGSHLHELAPLHWEKACALLRDVASSLAIIHSRRLVHRDVTPRNVRLAEHGRPKLIDFGAMTPMGETGQVVGTAPFVPPEAVNGQLLDGRADLFSLGATAYYLLTRRHAYAASKIAQLRDIWRSKPRPPSLFVPGIPPQLDSLVLSLLSLDRLARPVRAAEVIDRLSAIADLPQAEGLEISQAYLTTPTLVGRQEHMATIRKRMLRATRRRGGTLVLRGTSGMGRSRLLMACVLEAKLAGATVLKAKAEDGQGREYGVVQALAQGLLEAIPERTLEAARPDAAVLCHALPKLAKRLSQEYRETVAPKVFEDPEQKRPEVQAALRDFLTAVAARRYLTLAVDDVHRCDEPSVAVLAALSRDAPQLRLVLALTTEAGAETGPVSKAVEMLRRIGSCIELGGLSREQSERLLGSVFGDVPHIGVVADWVHRLSEGNPRICMELAQHLVDQGLARHQAGHWTLPASLQGQALPQSLQQELEARVARLSEPARQLARALSVVTEYAPLKLEHYGLLSEAEPGNVFAALDELVASQVLISHGEHYRFAHKGLVQALQRGLRREQRQHIHALLAAAYESGGYDKTLVTVYHLQQAGEGQRALALLVPLLEAGAAAEEACQLQVECCEAALQLAEASETSARKLFFLRKRLVLMAARHDRSLLLHAKGAERQLREDSGLVFWDQVGETLQPAERIHKCLELAEAAWKVLPEAERGLRPVEAVREIAAFAVAMTSAASLMRDLETLGAVYSLVKPFQPLSPAAELLGEIVGSVLGRLQGNDVLDRWRRLVASIRGPVPGLDATTKRQAVCMLSYYLALEESRISVGSASQWADSLQRNPRFVAHAWNIRMLAYLYDGDADEAHTCRERMEQAAIQNPESDSNLASSVSFEASAHDRCADLMGLKQVLVTTTQLAERHPGWLPHLHAVRGQYDRLRGDLQRARAHLENAVALAAPGVHLAWATAIASLVETVLEQGHADEAQRMAADALGECQKHNIDRWGARQLTRLLALAEARLGLHEAAARRVNALIKQAHDKGISGVWLGILYEARTRIAIEAQDRQAFVAYMKLTAAHYEERQNPTLLARSERLIEEASRGRLTAVTVEERHAETSASTIKSGGISQVARAILSDCETSHQRSEAALSLLVEHTGASRGYLFALRERALALVAPLDESAPPPELPPMLENYCSQITTAWSQTDDSDLAVDTGDTSDDDANAMSTGDGQTYYPVLMTTQREGRPVLAGVAALAYEDGRPASLDWNIVTIIANSMLLERQD